MRGLPYSAAAVLALTLAAHAQQLPVSPAPAVAAPGGPQNGPGPATPALVPDMPGIPPYVAPVPSQDTQTGDATPHRSAPSDLEPHFLGFLGPYRRPRVPELFAGSGTRLESLIRDGKLYLTLRDAIALAIENNLDVEVERYNLLLADTDRVRAQGGGQNRGIDYTIAEPPNGVGGPGSPLLNTDTATPNPTTPTLTDLTSLNSTTQTTTNLAGSTQSYSPGPNVPLFDPSLIATGGYLRRSDSYELGSTTTTATGTTQIQPLDFITANLSYLEGFRTGAQLEATANNASATEYGSVAQRDPFSQPSTSVTLTQPLLRGFGSAVNLRYLHIANLNRRVSRLLFEQQVLETVYGISRLYFDLVSLGENVAVKQEALRAAEKLRSDDANQVDQGTLAPIELTRAVALVSASQFDLIQAQGLYRQQEVILRNQLLRADSPVFSAQFSEIVPSDKIVVPPALDSTSVTDLIQQGLAHRPDLAQSQLQIKAGQISVAASRSQALPQLNLYANAQTRGVSEQAYESLGSAGTGLATPPQNLELGGLKVSTIYQAGVQLTLPLRNRVAESDAARDTIQLRQTEARTEKLANSIRQDVENAEIALETAFASYQAAITSRGYQEELLNAERDKLEFGQSTNLSITQNEAFLAQARSTEIAARSNYIKARIELDRATGSLLEKNGISLDDAIQGTVR